MVFQTTPCLWSSSYGTSPVSFHCLRGFFVFHNIMNSMPHLRDNDWFNRLFVCISSCAGKLKKADVTKGAPAAPQGKLARSGTEAIFSLALAAFTSSRIRAMRPSSRDRRPEDRTRQLRDGEGQNGGWWGRVDCKEVAMGAAGRGSVVSRPRSHCKFVLSQLHRREGGRRAGGVSDKRLSRRVPRHTLCLAGCVVAMPGTT
jgi:hypothetical protein